jgi:hypothetical protein
MKSYEPLPGAGTSDESLVISRKYYKIIRGYADLAMSALDKTPSVNPSVGNIISIDNASDFGFFTKYLLSNPKRLFMVRNVRIDETSLASVHKIYDAGLAQLPDYILGDSKAILSPIQIPNWRERYDRFKSRVVKGLSRVKYGVPGESSNSNASNNSWTSVEMPASGANNNGKRTVKSSLLGSVKRWLSTRKRTK